VSDVRISVRRIGVHGYDPMWEASLMIGDKAAFRRIHENRDVAERDLAEDIDRMALALGFQPAQDREGEE
jgi:hypothetical protein